ncbi:LORF2 protein, partial [Crocuta crocuta]
TMSCHLTPVTMARIKKTKNNRWWRGCEEHRTLMHCWWERQFMQPLWKTIWTSLKKLKIKGVSTTGYLPEKKETLIQKEIHTPMFTAELFTIAKLWKQLECSLIDEWIKKMWCIQYTHNGILYSHKQNKILPFDLVTTWKDLESIMLSEISQSETDKYHTISLT